MRPMGNTDPTFAEMTTEYFRSWESTFAGKFLERDGENLVVNRAKMLDHVPKLSSGEQLYCAFWWEIMLNRSIPWMEQHHSPLASLHFLDQDLQTNVVRLLAQRYRITL